MQILHGIVSKTAFADFCLEVPIKFVSSIKLSHILLRSQELTHLLLSFFLFPLGKPIFFLGQDEKIKLSWWHLAP
jgi:hypothetical protein